MPIGTFEPKMVTSNENLVQKPSSIRLLQNYPNPFNPQTIIPFEVNKPTHVRLEIYNVLGKRVAMLINQPFSEGHIRILSTQAFYRVVYIITV